jgi:3-methyladenine DNA glycosylase AlkD
MRKGESSIQEQLVSLSTEATKSSIQKFVPGSQKVYGVKMPLLNELCKQLKEGGFSLVYTLWQSGSFEEKMLAAKLINKLAKKEPAEALAAVKKFSNDIQDWAVCDTLGMQSLKPIAVSHIKEIFALAKKLNRSKNFWQRRLSLVLIEVYAKDENMHDAINTLLQPLKTDKEYYVKKAVEWIGKSMKKSKAGGKGSS